MKFFGVLISLFLVGPIFSGDDDGRRLSFPSEVTFALLHPDVRELYNERATYYKISEPKIGSIWREERFITREKDITLYVELRDQNRSKNSTFYLNITLRAGRRDELSFKEVREAHQNDWSRDAQVLPLDETLAEILLHEKFERALREAREAYHARSAELNLFEVVEEGRRTSIYHLKASEVTQDSEKSLRRWIEFEVDFNASALNYVAWEIKKKEIREDFNLTKKEELSSKEQESLTKLARLLTLQDSPSPDLIGAVLEARGKRWQRLFETHDPDFLSALSQKAFGKDVTDRSDIPQSYHERQEISASTTTDLILTKEWNNPDHQLENLRDLHQALTPFEVPSLKLTVVTLSYWGEFPAGEEDHSYLEEYQFVLIDFEDGESIAILALSQ